MRFRFLFGLAWLTLLLGLPQAALAQFETPSRAFHDATSFRLDGRHTAVACESCHLKGVYQGTPAKCVDCHWVRRQDDRFKTQLGTQCEQCHRTSGWTPVRWDHAAQTGTPLNVSHRQIACESCHKEGRFVATAVLCVTCHQNDYQQAKEPNHAAAGFPQTCETCHRPSDNAFTQATFDHNASFPLAGRHAQTTCASCHTNNLYKGTPRDCATCHRIDYERTANPSHAAAGFPTTCENCHRPSDPAWPGSGATAAFSHTASFPLTGRHGQASCVSCHKNSVYAGTPRECVACHQPDFERATNPSHVAAGFPTTCETCHRPSDASWRNGNTGVNHNAFFPLQGRHAQTACASCHVNNVFKGTPRDCVSCHRPQYERTTSPSHVAAGFSTSCESCHRATDASWQGAGFNHNAVFSLVGRHAQAQCASCHANNVYKGTPRDCVSCHKPEYDRTASPNHAAAGFGTTCESCHKPTDPSWRNGGTAANHDAFFPLVGRHGQAVCASCHVNNVYKGTPRDCVSCHRPLYDRTTSPNHAAAGFSTTCDTCHKPTDAAWRGVAFNHNALFQLQGRHAQTQCASCHANNVYKGTSRDCVGCHKPEYDRTASPNHVAAGFGTTCESCHKPTDASWRNGGTAANHDSFFPLVGRHGQAACASCHVNNVFKGTPRDCVGCHRPLYDRTTTPNHASAGFSTTCDTCHKPTDAAWRGVAFNHNTFFQLQGRHAQAACATCHANNVYKGTPRDCVGCHRPLYDRTTTPNHAAAGFSTTCDTCHKPTDAAWRGVAFNHNTFFQLQGRHAQAACATCHANNVYKGTPRDCVGCHRPLYDRTTNPRHVAAGFPTTCESCHRITDTAWNQGRFTHAFPLSGPHNRQCAECHTTANNFQQFSCIVCHTRGETDNEHRGRNGYRYESAACYSCHPNGRE